MDTDLQDVDIISYLQLKQLIENNLNRTVVIKADDMRTFKESVQTM
jgi:hypothetical protein